jgi:sugar phosphate isomerase/epimerase
MTSSTRRQLLGVTLAGAALPIAAAQRNIYWGLGIVTWTAKSKPGQLGWNDILPVIQKSGFDGVEPFTQNVLPVNDENMAELARLAPQHNVRMASIYWAGQFHLKSEREKLLKDCPRFLGYLKKFKCDRLTLGPPSPNVEDERAAILSMSECVNEIGRMAREEGIKTGVHPHVGGLIENPRQIDLLMRSTDPQYFNLSPDTAQIWMGGGEVVEMFEKHKNRIVYIHYKDIRAYNRGLRNYMDNVIELGKGVIDFPALHKILKSVKYKGWITIDLDNARISPYESAREQMVYIKERLEPLYA